MAARKPQPKPGEPVITLKGRDAHIAFHKEDTNSDTPETLEFRWRSLSLEQMSELADASDALDDGDGGIKEMTPAESVEYAKLASPLIGRIRHTEQGCEPMIVERLSQLPDFMFMAVMDAHVRYQEERGKETE